MSGKRNQYREENQNQHFLFAKVSYLEEFVSMLRDECHLVSCDDTNKTRMGPSTVVSRYHQISRFYMLDDSPNLSDHNFPNPGYLIVPSGYMSLSWTTELEHIDKEYFASELNDLTNYDEPSNEKCQPEEIEHLEDDKLFHDKLGRKHYKKVGPASLTHPQV